MLHGRSLLLHQAAQGALLLDSISIGRLLVIIKVHAMHTWSALTCTFWLLNQSDASLQQD